VRRPQAGRRLPSRPTVDPADGETITDASPTLEWSVQVDRRCSIESFDVRLARTPSFGALDYTAVVPGSARRYEFEAALSWETWYWRERALRRERPRLPLTCDTDAGSTSCSRWLRRDPRRSG
jgi:hypothetical protein